MKKLLARISIISLMFSILFGCCTVFAEADDGEADLVIMTLDADIEGYSDWIEYAEEQTGLKIEVIASPSNTDDRQAKFTTMLSSGDTTVDIFTVNDEMMSGYAKTNFLEPLQNEVMTEEVLNNFPRDYMEMASIQGENVFGVPMYLDIYLFWVNQAILDEVGAEAPTTLDEFKDFLAATSNENRYGYGGAWERTYVNNELTNFINMFGGDYFDWSNEKTIEAVEFMKWMADEGYTPASQMADQYDQLCQKISDGEYASMFVWTGCLTTLQQVGGYGADAVHEVTFPVFEEKASQIAAWQWVLSAASERKEAAFKFLKWAATADAQKTYSEAIDKLAANLEVINDETYTFPAIDNVRELVNNYTMYCRPFPPQTLEHISEVGGYFQQYINDEISIEDLCSLAQESIDEYFGL